MDQPTSQPSTFQRKTWWAAGTALAILVLTAVFVLSVFLLGKVMVYLQVLLIPLAIAAIMAYLLGPLMEWLCRQGISRVWATVLIFLATTLALISIIFWVAPAAYRQGNEFIQQFPQYADRTKELVNQGILQLKRLEEISFLRGSQSVSGEVDPVTAYAAGLVDDGIKWLEQLFPTLVKATGNLIKNSLGSVVGALPFILSFILVPIFLFFFLVERHAIGAHWMNYLPLRNSPLKNEIVSVVTEINQYLNNFFRGQLIVSLIDGALIGFCLLFLGLDFALLIGLMVGILAMIPYVGITICWIPALLISIVQFGDFWHPLIVTAIFIIVNQIDGIFIAPRVVGNSVGLHPFTVILSVLAWSIIIGGVLGALLAVPLTATLKVLLTRYVWDRSSLPKPHQLAPDSHQPSL